MTKTKTRRFDTLEHLISDVAEIIRPPERLTVPQAAEKYRFVNNPGSYVGPFKNEITPYMVEPQEILTSTEYTAMVFVGGAQLGKTESVLNWITHTAMCDPADMMIVETTQLSARDFSARRVKRLLRHSKPVGEMALPGRNNQNTYDTKFRQGWLLNIAWPAIGHLSGKPIPRIWITDRDRMPDDIDGEGDIFDLARKRNTTFGRYGMTAVESTPGREPEDPKWQPKTPHEAPPCKGILGYYNRGDRRRWYWPCPHCGQPFEPDFELLIYPDSNDFMEAAEAAYMACPACQGKIYHDGDRANGVPGKYDLNKMGRWIKDGMFWLPDGSVRGTPIRTDIASFWLKGVAAAFADWKTLVLKYLTALKDFEETHSQEALKTTVNVDQGKPYSTRGIGLERTPDQLKRRATPALGERVVPEGVRFLLASVDVQASFFAVLVIGIGVGGDVYVIDRFDVRKSARLDTDGERYMVAPGAYLEDWYQLIPEVILKTYPLADDPNRRMSIKAVACDSGGRAGVTENAYNFYRYLRNGPSEEDRHDAERAAHHKHWVPNLHRQFRLVKGADRKGAPRVQTMYPDSARKDRHAGARGEIPVLIINVDQIKDANNARIDRTDPNGGMISFPAWLPDWFYSEMTAEVRTAKGWENPKKLRNETWDLLCYCWALAVSPLVNIDRIDWSNPPSFAAEWDQNDLISSVDSPKGLQYAVDAGPDLKSLAAKLA